MTEFFGHLLANILVTDYLVTSDEDRDSKVLGTHSFAVCVYQSLLGTKLSEIHIQPAVTYRVLCVPVPLTVSQMINSPNRQLGRDSGKKGGRRASARR